MNDNPPPVRRGWGCLQWSAVGIAVLLLACMFVPTFGVIQDMADQTSTSSNCRQIMMALKIWANDHNGHFPDSVIPNAKSSNEVFRKLIMDDIIHEERIFGARNSPFQADGKVGTQPGFADAVTPGENHWMTVAGLHDRSSGITPFVFENTFYPHWPLIWRGDRFNEPIRGRAWRNGKIVIGRLDNSANVETLAPHKSVLILPDILQKAIADHAKPPLRLLDVEQKK